MLLFSYLNNIIHPYFVQFLTEPLFKGFRGVKVVKVLRVVKVFKDFENKW